MPFAALKEKIKSRMGEFWWYTLVIFLACRTGDLIQAFIGLWLVPKYVGQHELGAVLPLQQLASFLSAPLMVLAVVFSKYVNIYATRGEFGKVKSLIRDVLASSLALFIVCIFGAWLIMPFFYERLRISSGSLTVLVLLCGLATNTGVIVTACQQGLKRFRMLSLVNLVSAPIRLATLLVAMPFRPLSGYVLGQTTPSAATSVFALIDIRKALKPYAPDKSWRSDIPAIWRYLWPFAICTAVSAAASALNAMIYRQRLPEIESAAYYLLSRFSEIAAYGATALGMVMFPLASEAHERGEENTGLLWHSVVGSIAASLVLAAVFFFAAPALLSINSVWSPYLPYAWLLPVLTVNTGIAFAANMVSGYELACNRICPTAIVAAANLAFSIFLIVFTGCEFFRGILPDPMVDAMSSLQIAKLSTITFATSAVNLAVLAAVLRQSAKRTSRKRPR